MPTLLEFFQQSEDIPIQHLSSTYISPFYTTTEKFLPYKINNQDVFLGSLVQVSKKDYQSYTTLYSYKVVCLNFSNNYREIDDTDLLQYLKNEGITLLSVGKEDSFYSNKAIVSYQGQNYPVILYDFLSHRTLFYSEKKKSFFINFGDTELSVNIDLTQFQKNIDEFDPYFPGYKCKLDITGLSQIIKACYKEPYKLPEFSGCSKLFASLESIFKFLYENNLVVYYQFLKFLKNTTKSVDGVKISTLLNTVFSDITEEKIVELFDKTTSLDINIFKGHESYNAFFKKAVLSKQTGALKKLTAEAEYLPEMDPNKYPLLIENINNGNIPIPVFFRKEKNEVTYFTYNTTYSLWEEMLEKFPDETKKIAQSCARRSTYEKDVMSYFYFLLHGLPEYMKAFTGETWTCSPRVVSSSSELNPPSSNKKTRSALTPLPDNKTKNIVVPYCELSSPGRSTTYCYSLDYQVLKKGHSVKGDIVVKDFEENLNGRDDYGLMYYTLTGTDVGRGYPTFLIIKEKRKSGSFIHFHRVHPVRSKKNEQNPVSQWTAVCYNWMCGNIHKSMIENQQGDLVFVRTEKDLLGLQNHTADQYDDHTFTDPVYVFQPTQNELKENIVCYVEILEENILKHTEHEYITLPSGKYQVRVCKSWEANPKGVWSLRID